MPKLIPLATVIAIIGALAAGVAASSGAMSRYEDHVQSHGVQPDPDPSIRFVLGVTNCSKLFGNGVISATYTSTFNPATSAGTDNGPFTKWLLTGTFHGRYTGKYQFTSNTDAHWHNTITVSGGTGAFRGVTGKGSESCSTTNAGATLTCTEVLEVTGL